ncbi:MAG: agmatinase [Methanobacterium sp.]|nr:agmatinase [Methanobacterium sp.]
MEKSINNEKSRVLNHVDIYKNEKYRNFIKKMYESGNEQMFAPVYSGIPTFWRTKSCQYFSEIDIALAGYPVDLASGVPGARMGPRAIRDKSSYTGGYMNHSNGIIPFDICKVVDVGDVPLKNSYSIEEIYRDTEEFFKEIWDDGAYPITAGGDHSGTYPILKAIGEDKPVGLVHFDAHCDTVPAINGGKNSSGSILYHAVEEGVLDPRRTVQVGIRGPMEPFWDFSYDSGMRVLHIEEFRQMGVKRVIEEIREVIGRGPTYITIDIDALDPAYAPATEFPTPGGLTTIEMQQIIRGLQGANLVGGDVMELSPQLDGPNGVTAITCAFMMFEILCVIADSVASKQNSDRGC